MLLGADWDCIKSKQQPDEEVVVLSKVLAADINLGYRDTGNIQVLSVNSNAQTLNPKP